MKGTVALALLIAVFAAASCARNCADITCPAGCECTMSFTEVGIIPVCVQYTDYGAVPCGSVSPTATPSRTPTPTPTPTSTPTPALTPTPTPTPAQEMCGYERSVNSQGQVATEAMGDATRFRVGGDGSATITYTKRGVGGSPAITVRLYANTDFKLEPCAAPQLADGGGASLSGEGRVLHLSSEHGSLRGTINGGGDFIQGPAPDEMGLNPLPVPGRGKVSVVESGAADAPQFITEVSLRTGRMRIVSMGGYADYSVTPNVAAIAQPGEEGARLNVPQPYSEGAEISVSAGSVFVSDAATGRGRTLSSGETELLTIAELSSMVTPTPAADCGRHLSCNECGQYPGCGWSKAQARCLAGTMGGSGDGSSSGSDWAWTSGDCPLVTPTVTPHNETLECGEDADCLLEGQVCEDGRCVTRCSDSMDCPGTQVCKDGRCVESSRCSAFILLVLGSGAALLLARRVI